MTHLPFKCVFLWLLPSPTSPPPSEVLLAHAWMQATGCPSSSLPSVSESGSFPRPPRPSFCNWIICPWFPSEGGSKCQTPSFGGSSTSLLRMDLKKACLDCLLHQKTHSRLNEGQSGWSSFLRSPPGRSQARAGKVPSGHFVPGAEQRLGRMTYVASPAVPRQCKSFSLQQIYLGLNYIPSAQYMMNQRQLNCVPRSLSSLLAYYVSMEKHLPISKARQKGPRKRANSISC